MSGILTDNENKLSWLGQLDRILRGEAASPEELFRDSSKDADIRIPEGGMLIVLVVLGALYGTMMGSFAVVGGIESNQFAKAMCQVGANLFKVPLLFVLAIMITFPSLYVFSALIGFPFKIRSVLRLLIASLAITICVLASLGPIVAFFSVSSPNYHFIVLLNVALFAVAGALGLRFLIQTLRKMNPVVVPAELVQHASSETTPPEVTVSNPASSERPSFQPSSVPSVSGGGPIGVVFWCWMIAFGLVGSQLGWIMRPFVGSPKLPFQLFRAREGSFFEAVWNCLYQLLGG